MLGFEIAQPKVPKYMMRGRRPPSQSWKTFLENHAEAIAADHMCVVPTPTFERLFAFVVLGQVCGVSCFRNFGWRGAGLYPLARGAAPALSGGG
jgi:hypothetical protein